MSIQFKYWRECIATGSEENGITLSSEQIDALAECVQGCHENYSLAFYQPPSSDRLAVIEQDWKTELEAKQREFDAYRNNAETAIKRALKQRPDAPISIERDGEVFRHGGRTEQIL